MLRLIGGTGRLPQEGINEVIAYLVSKGNAIYEGKAKNKVRVYWRKPDEWAATIYRFVRSSTHTIRARTQRHLYQCISSHALR